MFLVRNQALAWSVRHSRDIFKTRPPRKDETVQVEKSKQHQKKQQRHSEGRSSFPYKFGGIQNYPADNHKIHHLLHKDTPLFSNYLELLKLIQEKNQKGLQNIVEKSLVSPLMNNSIRTQFLNKTTSGQILTHKFDMTIGSHLNRDKSMKFKRMVGPQSQIGFFISSMLNHGNKKKGGLPALITLQTTVLSKARLISDTQQTSEKQEAHSVTFQYERILAVQDIKDMRGMVAKLQLLMLMKSPDAGADTLKNFLFKDNSKWKIGNIDNFLPSRWQ